MAVKQISFHKQEIDLPEGLDSSQWEAVFASLEGKNTAVIGAPGTGKTTVLLYTALGFAAENGLNPGDLMMLTSNRRNAAKLRDLLFIELGKTSLGSLAKTPTSWALEIVKSVVPEVSYLSGPELDSLLEAVITELLQDPSWAGDFTPIALDTPYFRGEVRKFAEMLTAHSTTADELSQLAKKHRIAEWKIVADVLQLLEKTITLSGSDRVRLSSAEIISAAATLLRESRVPAPKILIVDDLQDVSPVAINLLAAAAQAGSKLVVALDPDVSTAAFRGGSSSVLRDLELALGAEIKQAVLTESHRMGELIAKVAAEVSSRIGTAGVKEHRKINVKGRGYGKVYSVTENSVTNLGLAIAKYLYHRRLSKDVPWHDMAVITRNSLQEKELAKRLVSLGIPVSSESVISSGHASSAANSLVDFALLAFQDSSLTREQLDQVLEGALPDINAIELRRLKAGLRAEEIIAGGSRTSEELLLEAFHQQGGFVTIGSAEAKKLEKLQNLFTKAKELAPKSTPEELIYYLLEKSGLLKRLVDRSQQQGLVGAEALRQLEAVNALIFDARVFTERNPEASTEIFLSKRKERSFSADSLVTRAQTMGVVVATAAAVVGSEFDSVVVAGLEDGSWPNLRLRGNMVKLHEFIDLKNGASNVNRYRENIEDELRYLHLALSRASKSLLIAAVADDETSPSVFFELLAPYCENIPTEMLVHPSGSRNLVAETRRRINSAIAEGLQPADEDIALLQLLAKEGVKAAEPESWLGLQAASTNEPLFDPELPVKLSPSNIQRIIDNPRKWFEEKYFSDPATFYMALGTIFHAAIEKFPEGPIESIQADLEQNWSELEFDSEWQAKVQAKTAIKLLEGYEEYLHDLKIDGVEWKASEIGVSYEDEKIVIYGKIDRLETSGAEGYRVVDIKTSSDAPSKNAAEQNIQLQAYQICLLLGANSAEVTVEPEKFGGAALLYPRISQGRDSKKRKYAILPQSPLSNQGIELVLQEFHEAGDSIRGPQLANKQGLFVEQDFFSQDSVDIQNIEEVTE